MLRRTFQVHTWPSSAGRACPIVAKIWHPWCQHWKPGRWPPPRVPAQVPARVFSGRGPGSCVSHIPGRKRAWHCLGLVSRPVHRPPGKRHVKLFFKNSRLQFYSQAQRRRGQKAAAGRNCGCLAPGKRNWGRDARSGWSGRGSLYKASPRRLGSPGRAIQSGRR